MKSTRYIARALALIWAVWWMFFALVSGAGEGFRGLLANAPNALPQLVFLISVAIAWRWEAVGGILLLLCALGSFFFFHIGRHLFMHLTFIFPPVLAGFLFLVCSWKSKALRVELKKTGVHVKKALLLLLRTIATGVVVGIIVGMIVSYLFSGPVISLNDTAVKIKEDKIDVAFDYENKGKSCAVNVTTKYLYGIDGDKPQDFIPLKPKSVDKVGVGDVFSYTALDLPRYDRNKDAILLICVKYEDSNKIRQIVNEKLLRNTYTMYRWTRHSKDKKILSAIQSHQKDCYKGLLSERIAR